MSIQRKAVLILFATVLSAHQRVPFASPPEQVDGKENAANQLIQNMLRAYRNVSSYQDRGTVEVLAVRKSGTDRHEVTFSIAFQRPDLLRVEWTAQFPTGELNRSTLVGDGEKVFVQSSLGGEIKEQKDLRMGIAAATGVSMMAAHTIPSLLLESASGGSVEFSTLKDASVLDDEDFEGVPCHVLTATDPSDEQITYWLGAEDYFIRKVQRITESTQRQMQHMLDTLDNIKDEKLRDSIRQSVAESSRREDSSQTISQIHREIRVNEPMGPETFTAPNANEVKKSP